MTPRVLIAVVLDMDEAAVHWPALEACLLAQETDLWHDLLIVDITEQASENYADWLRHIERTWPRHRARTRRLVAEDRGERQSFSLPSMRVHAGKERAWELFSRWKSYAALWLLRPDARPEPGELQRLWDSGDLLLRDPNYDAAADQPPVIWDIDQVGKAGPSPELGTVIGVSAR